LKKETWSTIVDAFQVHGYVNARLLKGSFDENEDPLDSDVADERNRVLEVKAAFDATKNNLLPNLRSFSSSFRQN
jgi:hypothetical protein